MDSPVSRQNVDKTIRLPEVIGGGYKQFWNFKGRYRVVKGGRASKKSKTTALNHIWRMMQDFHKHGQTTHTLVIRSNFNLHFNSTYKELKWATDRLGVAHLWKWTKSPLQAEYIPSGGTIIFRGMNDPDGLTSITVDKGFLTYVFIEEAFQLTSEEDFEKLDFSVRGHLPEPLFHQITLIFNPWHEGTWLKSRFFDKVNKETGVNDTQYDARGNIILKEGTILAVTKNFDCNEWLSDEDREMYEHLRLTDPRRFNIVGLGEWGVAEGLVFENWKALTFDVSDKLRQKDNRGKPIYTPLFGMDFGWVDATAIAFVVASKKTREIFIFDEVYGSGMSNMDIVNAIDRKNIRNSQIIADSADQRSINELKKYLPRLKGVKKSKDFKLAIIRGLSDYTIYIHPECINAITEFSTYAWETDRLTGKVIEKLPDGNDHFIDAFLYSISEFGIQRWRWG